jgi:hypothetical protein
MQNLQIKGMVPIFLIFVQKLLELVNVLGRLLVSWSLCISLKLLTAGLHWRCRPLSGQLNTI